MPTYLSFIESEFDSFSEAEYLDFEEGDNTTPAGYFDTFSMLFGWWYSEPIAYRYYDFGNFYIMRSKTDTYYITSSHTKTYYIHTDGPVT